MRAIKWLDKHLEETILVFFLALICCIMLLQVFMRYILNDSIAWAEEFCRYCYAWTAFFSLGYTVRCGNMLRVGVVVDMLPKALRKLAAIFANAVCLMLFTVFFVGSIGVVEAIRKTGQTSPAMGWPMYIVYFCTVIGFGLGALRTVQAIISQLRRSGERRANIEAAGEGASAGAETDAAMTKGDRGE